jgi:tetratricopeptide (TPR) repeat protein
VLSLHGAALAQATLPAAPEAPPPTSAPSVEAPSTSPPSPAAAAPDKASDTRGEALRAYNAALESRKLAATVPLSTQRLQSELSAIEDKILQGRRDEAIGDLVYLVESPRFDAFAKSDEGRAALFLLGDSLGRAGAYEPGRAYLVRLLEGSPNDTWYRRATDSLVDLAL